MSGVLTLNIPGDCVICCCGSTLLPAPPPRWSLRMRMHTRAASIPTLMENPPPWHTLHPHPTGAVSQGCRCHSEALLHPDSRTSNYGAALGGRGGGCWVGPCFIDPTTVMNQLLWSWCLPADRYWPLCGITRSPGTSGPPLGRQWSGQEWGW